MLHARSRQLEPSMQRMLAWQLGLLAVFATASQNAPYHDASVAKPSGHCPSTRLMEEAALFIRGGQCTRHGPCYRGGDTEFCVFTATANDSRRRPTVLSVVAERERALSITHFSSNSAAHTDHHPSEPRYTISSVPGKGLGVISTGSLARGDHIMSDSPTLIVDHCMMATVPQYDLAWLMNEAASRLSEGQRNRTLSLAVFGDAPPDEHYLVGRIYATSAYMVDSPSGWSFEGACGIGALFPEGPCTRRPCEGLGIR